MPILVIAEHARGTLRLGSRSAVAVARDIGQQTGADVEILVLGADLAQAAADAGRYAPVVAADHALLADPTADRYAQVIADVARAHKAHVLIAAATTFSRDILPRATALLNGAMAGDVVGYSFDAGKLLLKRPMYAGGVTATVSLALKPQVITVRASAFPAATPAEAAHPVVAWKVDESSLPRQIEYLGLESRATDRPELTEARVVVSGGRAFRDAAEFEQHVGRLADALGGATGCTRALVDSGIAPNEWQVGQTGKVVAPELYVALGISGAVQHMAGMKNSRVVVAVNSDPEAPIFGVANYGLVGDVKTVVPELIERLSQSS
ncbi:MAG: electron transfer flavoprotein subunit alpha/FixB family protein [Planctomycetaceae bacterium]